MNSRSFSNTFDNLCCSQALSFGRAMFSDLGCELTPLGETRFKQLLSEGVDIGNAVLLVVLVSASYTLRCEFLNTDRRKKINATLDKAKALTEFLIEKELMDRQTQALHCCNINDLIFHPEEIGDWPLEMEGRSDGELLIPVK